MSVVSSNKEPERKLDSLLSTIELMDIDVQRYNMIADLEFTITQLRQDDYRENIKPIRETLKSLLERYIKLLRLLDNEKRNKEYIEAIRIQQMSEMKTSDIPSETPNV